MKCKREGPARGTNIPGRKESEPISELRFPLSLPGFDPKLVPSVTESLTAISSMTVIDEATLNKAAKTFQSFQPIVAPQIAETLAKMTVTGPTEAMKAMAAAPAFNFAKTLENLDISAITGARVAESFQTLDISKIVKASVFNLRDLPPAVTADIASQFDRRAQEAVALAEVDEVAEGVEEAVGAGLNSLTSAEKHALALDVVLLIAAFLFFSAWLTQKAPEDSGEGAGAFLTCAAMYIRVYWRLIGKL